MNKEDLEQLVESYPKHLIRLAELYPPSFTPKPKQKPKLEVVK